MYFLVVIEFIGGRSIIMFTWIIIIELVNTILGVPTILVVVVHGSLELILKSFPIKAPFDPRPKFATDSISTPPLTKFVLGATTIYTFVVGITSLRSWVTFISISYLRILTIVTFDTLSEVEFIWVWLCPILWLPIGIRCGTEWGCDYIFDTLLLNWMDGWIYQLCGPNWPPNSMPLNLFWTKWIHGSYSCDWSINVPATFSNSTCLAILILMCKGTKGQSMIACPSSSQNA